MSQARLRSLLREVPLPGEEGAERRGLAVVGTAFAQRRRPQRNPLPRIALAMTIATLLGALLLSPAGAAVRDWVGDVFTAGVRDAEPSLTEVPGGGRLLVQSQAGPWVVRGEGSRRLLGDYDEATWSPRGLFVAVASGATLSALEPDGTPRWSLGAVGAVSDPRWSPSGLEIAYRVGSELRVVDADGSDDRLVDPSVRPVPAAWSPFGEGALAYVDADGRTRVVAGGSGDAIGARAVLPHVANLEWRGQALLESSPRALRLRKLAVGKLSSTPILGPAHEIALPAAASVRDAALSPRGDSVAALLSPHSVGPARSLVLLAGGREDTPRRLLSTPGRLSEIAWSPDGSRLLIAWPDADQWLFVPVAARGRVRAVGEIAAQFAPGQHGAAFPRVEGWCCPAIAGAGG